MHCHWLWRVLCLCVLVCHCIVAFKFSNVTNHVGLQDAYGRIVNFADFNADKTTDILFRSGEGYLGGNFSVYLWKRGEEQFHHLYLDIQNASTVVYTAVVDLDADGQVDLLTVSLNPRPVEGGDDIGERDADDCYTLGVHWMRPGPVVDSYQVIDSDVIYSKPLVIDANGDHIPDLFIFSCSGEGVIWTSKGFIREFESSPVTMPSLEFPEAFHVDLTNDNLADVVVLGRSSNSRVPSVVFLQRKTSCPHPTSFLSPSPPVPLPPSISSARVMSGPVFADLDGDGATEAVIFTCPDPDCSTVNVHILFHESADSSPTDCTISSTHPVNFTHVHTTSVSGVFISPYSSHDPVIGDVDLDGLPDVIIPAARSDGVLLMVTRQCHTHCDGSRVTFDPQWLPVATGNITSVAFFDLWEDGVLDVLVTEVNDVTQQDGAGQLRAFRHHLQDDHAFLKILVLSGHCHHNCKSGQKPYGSVLPGAVVSFSTKDRMGRQKRGVCTLTSGSTLHLPFIVFGLGQTPSLVEEVQVVVEGEGKATSHTWRNLVPNSQIIVIPHPPDQPHKWRLELYLTPGELVYSTAGGLAAIFLATAAIVLLLQAREKFQDTKEKRMAKHRFHFNAM